MKKVKNAFVIEKKKNETRTRGGKGVKTADLNKADSSSYQSCVGEAESKKIQCSLFFFKFSSYVNRFRYQTGALA